MKRSKNTGFTLVELLVVITILGMLMALIFPAFAGVMELTRQTECKSNIKSLLTATTSYLSVRHHYPGLVEPRGYSKNNPGGNRCTWATLLLQHLDEGSTMETWEMPPSGGGSSSGGNSQRPLTVKLIKQYLCPNDTQLGLAGQPLSYVANAGHSKDVMVSLNATSRQSSGGGGINFANGIFFNRYNGSRKPAPRMTTSHIVDGRSQTAMFSENIQAWQWADKRPEGGQPMAYDEGTTKAEETAMYTGFVWNGLNFNRGESEDQDINQKSRATGIQWARPSSKHPEGAMMGFCDDNVKMVNDTIEPWVYRRLVVSDRNKSDLPQDDPARTGDLRPGDY